MNLDFSLLRDKWLQEKPTYVKFASHIENELSQQIRSKGFWARTSSRAKELDSLLKKVFRKNYDEPFRQMSDLAGVRVTVKFLEHLQIVQEIVAATYDVIKCEDKSNNLDFNEFGYSGIHMEVQLLTSSLSPSTKKFSQMICEIQIRTLSQDVWAEMDHDFSYKSDLSIPQYIKRKIYRLSALLEILDNEFEMVKQEIVKLPEYCEYGILTFLERHFFRFVGGEYDKELSLEILKHLKILYDNESVIESLINSFVDENFEKIVEMYQLYRKEHEHPILLYQPEIFLIFERLEADEFQLINTWQEYYPFEELQDIASVWGRPLE